MTNEVGKIYDHITTLLLRLFIGLMMLSAGLGKFGNLAGFQQYIHHDFDKTFLAGPLLDLFAYAQPYAEVVLGALVLMGLLTRPILALTALNLIVLFFGKWVVHDFQTAAYNSLYVLITIYALCRSKDNRFSLDYLICSCCCRGKKQENPTCCK
jgi:thiosulfate dehydrogenase [quinone] large subunit